MSVCEHTSDEGCYLCCPRCNHDEHRCPGCGDDIPHGKGACDACTVEVARGER